MISAVLARGKARRLAACLSWIVLATGFGCSREPPPPSVVLVVLDTFRWDHLGALSGRDGLTPRMDALAEESVLFEHCFSQYPLTLPSLSTVLASEWPFVHGIQENYQHRLGEEAVTLAEVLKERGYRTGAFVSALPIRRETGCAQGFDVYDDDFSVPFTFYREEFRPLTERWTGSERRGDLTVERALAWLERTKEPAFLFVHLFDAHSPYDAPPEYASRQETPYAGEVAFVDALVGRVLDGISTAFATPPIVAIIADHGEGLGEHEEWAHGLFLYDSTIRVPWILSAPGRITPRRVENGVRLLDVAPTLLELAEIPAPVEWAGRSCAALARGDTESARELYAENFFTRVEYGWSEEIAWITPDRKWIRVPRPELYDRAADPAELVNLAPARPAEAARLDGELGAFVEREREGAKRRGVPSLAEEIQPEARVREWLTNLGYVSASGPPVTRGPLPDPKDRVPEWNRTNEARTHAGRGRERLAAGDLVLARGAFERSLSLASTPEGEIGYGLTLNRLGAFEAAKPHFVRALEHSPNDLPALLGYAACLDALGDAGGADSLLFRATLVDSTSFAAWGERGLLAARARRLDEAVRYLRRAVHLAPDHAPSLEALASAYRALGRYADEAAIWKALLARRDWDPIAHWRLGEALRLAGQLEPARAALSRAREIAGRGALADSIAASLRLLGPS